MSNVSLIMPKLDEMLEEKEILWNKTEYPRYLCAELKGYIEAIKDCRKLLLGIGVSPVTTEAKHENKTTHITLPTKISISG